MANWLLGELRKLGVKTDEQPGQEDFGWYLDFYVADIGHTCVILYRPGVDNDKGTWIGWLERKRGFIGSVLGTRSRGIDSLAAEMLHTVVARSSQIRDVRWHFQRDFDRGLEERGALEPCTPS